MRTRTRGGPTGPIRRQAPGSCSRRASTRLAAAVVGLTAAGAAMGDTATWAGGTAGNDWADPANWAGALPAGNDVVFGPAGAQGVAGAVSSFVGTNYAIASLYYAQSSALPAPGAYHTTAIGAGATLNVTGPAGLRVGLIGYTAAADLTTFASLTGLGRLNVTNTNAAVVVTNDRTDFAGPHAGRAVLDLSGLATFGGTVGAVLVGGAAGGTPAAGVRAAGTLVLAATNHVSAASVYVGYGASPGGVPQSELLLGGSNNVRVDTLRVGYGAGGNGRLAFDPNRATRELRIVSRNGGLGGDWRVGDSGTDTAGAPTTFGEIALGDGVVTGGMSTLVVGRSASGDPAAQATGLVTVNAQNFTATTMVVGQTAPGSQGNATGTFTLAGGEMSNRGIVLGDRRGGGVATGTLHVAGGDLEVDSVGISDGGGTSNVVVGSGGTLWLHPGIGTSIPRDLGSAAEPIDRVELHGTIRGSGNAFVRELSGGGTYNVTRTLSLVNAGDTAVGATFTGAGRVLFAGSGTVALLAGASLAAVPQVHVGPAAVVDATAQTLAIANTLTGTGTIRGEVKLAGGTLLPGEERFVGTLTLAGTLRTSSNAVLRFDLGNTTAVGGGANDLVEGRDLAVDGPTAVHVSPVAGALANGSYRLLNYAGTVGGSLSNLALAGPVLAMRQMAVLDTATPGQVNLVVSGPGPQSLTWRGSGSANWNLRGDANFVNGAAAADAFYQLDAVAFTDAATNASAVVLQGDLAPQSVFVDATRNYAFSGTGRITGTASLTKSGPGTLVLDNQGRNTFNGPVTITGGTVEVPRMAFGTTATALGAPTTNAARLVLDGGTLRYTGTALAQLPRGFTLGTSGATFEAAAGGGLSISTTDGAVAFVGTGPRTITLTGSGTSTANALAVAIADGPGGTTSIVKDGSGAWTLGAGQQFTGTITVNAGVLRTTGFGAGSTNTALVVNPGATLDIRGGEMGDKRIVISGSGTGGGGALLNDTGDSLWALTHVTLAGDATIGNRQRMDIRGVFAQGTLSTGGVGYKLTKVGTGQFSLVDVAVDPALGDIDVRAGTFNVEAQAGGRGTASLGSPTNTVTVAPGAVFAFWGMVAPIDKRLVLDSATFRAGFGTRNEFVGPVVIGGPATVDVANLAQLRLGGVVSGGTNGLTKTGPGTLVLGAENAYGGTTRVTAGTLRVTGSVSNSAGITVGAAAAFDAAASQRVRALAVGAGGSAVVSAGVLTVGDGLATSPLTLGSGTGAGVLDLRANALVVDTPAGDVAAALVLVRDAIVAGHNAAGGGNWLGRGIRSASASADLTRGVGYARAEEILGPTGGDYLGAAVDGSGVIARYTLLGDATLDGAVDFSDLVKLAQNYSKPVDGDSWWVYGDFTYDGNVDFNDLVKLAQNYNQSLAGVQLAQFGPGFASDAAAAFASVPEPSILGWLTTAAVGAGSGRRRRRH